MTTKTATHTPGPWSVDGPIPSNPEIRINYAPMSQVATIVNPGEHLTDIEQDEALANARLIAAAPEMLEALEQIAEGRGTFSLDHHQHAKNTIEEMKALAVAAIQKARGGQ